MSDFRGAAITLWWTFHDWIRRQSRRCAPVLRLSIKLAFGLFWTSFIIHLQLHHRLCIKVLIGDRAYFSGTRHVEPALGESRKWCYVIPNRHNVRDTAVCLPPSHGTVFIVAIVLCHILTLMHSMHDSLSQIMPVLLTCSPLRWLWNLNRVERGSISACLSIRKDSNVRFFSMLYVYIFKIFCFVCHTWYVVGLFCLMWDSRF